MYAHTHTHTNIHIHTHPAGPETVLVKTMFLKTIVISPQRNCHFPKPNLTKFSRENWAKFAFRVGFALISSEHVNHFFLPFKGSSKLKWFSAGNGYVDSHISIARISRTREDLCCVTSRVGDEVFDSTPWSIDCASVAFHREATSKER